MNVALQYTVFNQHIALTGVAFVVDVERAPAIGNCAVIEYRHTLRRHALADTACKSAGTLAIEVAFKSVANRFVQQNTGPARAEYDRHFTSWRWAGFKVG